MLSPIKTMFLHFPLRAYTTVFLMIAVSVCAYLRIKRSWKGGRLPKWRGFIQWTLVNYVIVLLFFTVFGRRSLDYLRYNFDVGYSYRDVLYNKDYSMAFQIGANIVAFIPLGCISFLAVKRWRLLKGLLCGITLSVCIECLQLVMRNGNCEIDDLISNALGTLVGCLLAWCILPKRKNPDNTQ